MQVVVLAGGRGTRLAPLTDRLPKALVPVNGRPFAEHQIDLLQQGGATSLLYSIGHLGSMIRDHLGDGGRFGLPINYVDDGDRPLGTAGALRRAATLDLLNERFLLIYGDSYLPVDLRPIWQRFTASNQPALMTVFRNDGRWDRSNVAMAGDGRTIRLYDKAGRHPEIVPDHIDFGISGLSRDAVLADIPDDGAAHDLADLMYRLSHAGQLAGFRVETRFWEIGSHDGLAELEQALHDGDIPAIGTAGRAP